MRTYAVVFVLSLVVSLLATPLARRLAIRFDALDQGGGARRLHVGEIPRLGGVAIFLGFFVPVAALLLYDNRIAAAFKEDLSLVLGLFLGGAAIFALGVYDDLRGANSRQKFLVQFAVAAGMYALGFEITVVANPFGDLIHLGWLSLPVTLLWIVGISNAMNLIDGLDGLAAGVAFFALATVFGVAFVQGSVVMIVLATALGGAVLGFMPYNMNPARIFMGDSGSLFLGFVLAITSVKASQKSATAVSLLIPIVALGLPIADTFLAMLRRLVHGKSLFTGDKDHIHHRLIAKGLSQRNAALVLYASCLVLAICGLALTFASSRDTAIMLAALGVLLVLLVRWLGYGSFQIEVWRRTLRERHRNQLAQLWLVRAGDLLEEAQTAEQVWSAIRPLGDLMNCSEIALELRLDDKHFRWTAEGDSTGNDAFSIGFPLSRAGRELGKLQLGWANGRTSIDDDEEKQLNRLVARLSAAVARLVGPVAAAAVGASADPSSNVVPLKR